MIRLIVRPSAELDIREAAEWYEDEEAGLGGQFVDELRHIVSRIRELPSQFPDVGRGTRRALLKRFPYAIYFLLRGEADQRAAVILAILHQRRRPSVWKKRTRDEGGAG
ncbi:type II toxin-antitoxin system RelE/ParE family toxin [Sorangium sp. So ce693]|uniref:type II toxin-antitoxin system RelE/ParE family toxin n=1 Tax=Sorangium sp. So ce693 TaxID=3133318 RepID=UPI003F635467